MARSIVIAVLLVGVGVVAGAFFGLQKAPEAARVASANPSFVPQGSSAPSTGGAGERNIARWERRLDLLAAEIEREAAERRRLQDRLDEIAAELAALRAPAGATAETAPLEPNSGVQTSLRADGPVLPPASREPPFEEAPTPTERALIAAGIDPFTAGDIKRRRDELALAEIYLRDQATREGWLDTPRFSEEMAEIARQRVSMRDEIGDDAYDRYLAALGHPNRVRVDEVFVDSPAFQAGLQAGDVVLRYGEARIFVPSDLVGETHDGTAGETVRLEILRGGERLEVVVPRGPLGVRVAASASGAG
jgi:hypothetical protein